MPEQHPWTRRRFLTAVGAAAATAPLACLNMPAPSQPGGGSARLTARPGTPSQSITPGTWPLGLRPGGDDGSLLVPASYQAGTAMPLVLALHGAGGRASGPIEFRRPYAEARGFLVLAVNSERQTWDALLSGYGFDTQIINLALAHTFERCTVDPGRVVVEGFSDGASYALGLGLDNGDLFSRVVAFSPGGILGSDSPEVGQPEFFISHGRQDPILPIHVASRSIVSYLLGKGYEVDFHEFDGGHEIPAAVAGLATDWLMQS